MNAGRFIAATCLAAALAAFSIAAHPAEPPSFKRDIAPLLKVRCAACHLTGEEPGGMALHPGAARRSLVGVAALGAPLERVSAGSPDKSYIVHKLQGTHLDVGGTGLRMPMDGPPLSEEQIETIRAWIAAGAPDN